jgi:hypothetical protein
MLLLENKQQHVLNHGAMNEEMYGWSQLQCVYF